MPEVHAEGPTGKNKNKSKNIVEPTTPDLYLEISHFSLMFASDSSYYLTKLALGYTISIVDDPGGLEASGFVELDKQLPHHVGQVLDDVLTVLLHPHCGAVSAGVGIHATDHLKQHKFF